jgi:hypothetical protein
VCSLFIQSVVCLFRLSDYEKRYKEVNETLRREEGYNHDTITELQSKLQAKDDMLKEQQHLSKVFEKVSGYLQTV